MRAFKPIPLKLRSALSGLIVAGVLIACGGPKYPNCETDEHCNLDGRKGFCINAKCIECKTDATCGNGRSCNAGACAAIENYCDDKTGCPTGKACSGNRCESAVTVAPVSECDATHPCTAPARCQNGHCYTPPTAAGCEEFPSPKFSFESAALTDDAKKTVERLAKCLQGPLKGRKLLLTGHCDARGEYEFNMGLGAERAEAVRQIMIGMGIPADGVSTSSRGKLDANGQDEAGYASDRRVDIEIR